MIEGKSEALKLERKRFGAIFSVEMMERFGFYSFNVLLVMYFVSHHGMAERTAIALFAAFSALLYVFIPLGGWIGDSCLGTKHTINLGGLFMLVGYILLASFNNNMEAIPIALGFIIIGNGLFKANPSSLLSKIYEKTDSVKRDSAYSLYYMSINVGSFVSKILSPFAAHKWGWQYGFAIGGFGLFLGLIYFNSQRKHFVGIGSTADMQPQSLKKNVAVIALSLAGVALCSFLLHHVGLTKVIMFVIVGCAFIGFLILSLLQPGHDKKTMIAALVFTLIAIAFYTMYQQMYTSFLFFAKHNSHHNILGIPVHPTQFTVLNPVVIIIMAPLLAKLYKILSEKGINIRLTTKFTIGLIFTASAFLILVPAKSFADPAGIVSSNWIVSAYILVTMGEILIAAIGLSMISQLIPEKFMGFATGIWFLSTAISGITGGIIASLTSPVGVGNMTNVQIMNNYSHTFLQVGLGTLGVAVVMFILKFFLDKFIYTE